MAGFIRSLWKKTRENVGKNGVSENRYRRAEPFSAPHLFHLSANEKRIRDIRILIFWPTDCGKNEQKYRLLSRVFPQEGKTVEKLWKL